MSELPLSTADNPLGLDGFAFVEFTGPDPEAMAAQLSAMGFSARRRHDNGATAWVQDSSVFVLNHAPKGQAADFAAAHGPSANGMGFRVADAQKARQSAVTSGARAFDTRLTIFGDRVPALEGIGGSVLYLIDHDPFADWHVLPDDGTSGVGLGPIDHLTHNVQRGHMRLWSDFYARVFGFAEQRYFDIKGQATGLLSQAMIAPDGAIRIPLNESQDDQSQIEEFLRLYRGEGIQHIALTTDDIYATVEALRARGVRLQDTIDTYYDLIDRRVPDHDEDVERLRRNRILIDGNREEGILLQIFTEPVFGPIFFEIIQRKGNQGFGNGNFQALFESIELDQIRRGVIKVA